MPRTAFENPDKWPNAHGPCCWARLQLRGYYVRAARVCFAMMGGDCNQGQPREIYLRRPYSDKLREKPFEKTSDWDGVRGWYLAVDPVCVVAFCLGYSFKESATTSTQHSGILGRQVVNSTPEYASSFEVLFFLSHAIVLSCLCVADLDDYHQFRSISLRYRNFLALSYSKPI